MLETDSKTRSAHRGQFFEARLGTLQDNSVGIARGSLGRMAERQINAMSNPAKDNAGDEARGESDSDKIYDLLQTFVYQDRSVAQVRTFAKPYVEAVRKEITKKVMEAERYGEIGQDERVGLAKALDYKATLAISNYLEDKQEKVPLTTLLKDAVTFKEKDEDRDGALNDFWASGVKQFQEARAELTEKSRFARIISGQIDPVLEAQLNVQRAAQSEATASDGETTSVKGAKTGDEPTVKPSHSTARERMAEVVDKVRSAVKNFKLPDVGKWWKRNESKVYILGAVGLTGWAMLGIAGQYAGFEKVTAHAEDGTGMPELPTQPVREAAAEPTKAAEASVTPVVENTATAVPPTEVPPSPTPKPIEFTRIGNIDLSLPISIDTGRAQIGPNVPVAVRTMADNQPADAFFLNWRENPNGSLVYRTDNPQYHVIEGHAFQCGFNQECLWEPLRQTTEENIGEVWKINGQSYLVENVYRISGDDYREAKRQFTEEQQGELPYEGAFFFDTNKLGLPALPAGEERLVPIVCEGEPIKFTTPDGVEVVQHTQAVIMVLKPVDTPVEAPAVEDVTQTPYIQEVEQLRDVMNEYPNLYPQGQDSIKMGDYLRQQGWYAAKKQSLNPEQVVLLEAALDKLNANTYRYRRPGTEEWQFTQCVAFIGLLSALGYSESPVDISRASNNGQTYQYPGELIPDNLNVMPGYDTKTINNLTLTVGSVPITSINPGDLLVSDRHVAAVVGVTDGPNGSALIIAEANRSGDGRVEVRTADAQQIWLELATGSNGLQVIRDNPEQ